MFLIFYRHVIYIIVTCNMGKY